MAKEQAPEKPQQIPLIPGSLIPLDNPFPNGLTGAQLAARLGVNPSTISRNGRWEGDKFSQWAKLSKEEFRDIYPKDPFNPKSQKIPDPDGLGWQKRGDRYFPVRCDDAVGI